MQMNEGGSPTSNGPLPTIYRGEKNNAETPNMVHILKVEVFWLYFMEDIFPYHLRVAEFNMCKHGISSFIYVIQKFSSL